VLKGFANENFVDIAFFSAFMVFLGVWAGLNDLTTLLSTESFFSSSFIGVAGFAFEGSFG
jgi:hypothetical protein